MKTKRNNNHLETGTHEINSLNSPINLHVRSYCTRNYNINIKNDNNDNNNKTPTIMKQ